MPYGRDASAPERRIATRGEIVRCADPIESPVSGRRAAAWRFAVGTYEYTTDRDGRQQTRRRRLGEAVRSAELEIRAPEGVIWVPASSFDLGGDGPLLDDLPLTASRVPAAVEHLVQPGAILYGETSLNVGDVVSVDATVRPTRRPGADLELVSDGTARLRDQTLEEMGIAAPPRRASGWVAVAVIGIFALACLATLSALLFAQ